MKLPKGIISRTDIYHNFSFDEVKATVTELSYFLSKAKENEREVAQKNLDNFRVVQAILKIESHGSERLWE